jgi:hypothetical protein
VPQEQEKRFNDAAEAMQKWMTLCTASKNVNVPHRMLSRIAQCNGIHKSALSCFINQIFSEKEEKEPVKYLKTASRINYGLS